VSRSAQIWLIGLILAAAALRWHGFFTNTFHTDEALFASWARLIAVGRDLTLQSQAVDKPPLAFYLQSVGFPLVGNVSWAARIPNLVASLLLIPLVAQWTWRLYRDELAALIAAAVIALSPLAIQFSGTAFLDPLLTTFLVSALLLVCVPSGRAKPLLAGFVFGLAVATKYQAWLFLPLIGGIAWLFGWRWRSWQRWLVGFLPVVAVVLVFGGGTLLARQWQSYGGIRPIFSWELLPRGLEWLENMAYVTGTLWSLLFLIGIIITFLLQNQRSSRFSRIHPASQRSPDILCPERIRAEIVGNEVANLPGYKSPGYSAAPAEAGLDGLLLAFLVGYLVLHWLLAIPIWERYLLPVLPIFCGVGRAGGCVGRTVDCGAFRPNSGLYCSFATHSATDNRCCRCTHWSIPNWRLADGRSGCV
jgi:4-amino-4-deoxy-L-arabinose transferase-like glycosyltransferase